MLTELYPEGIVYVVGLDDSVAPAWAILSVSPATRAGFGAPLK